MLIFFNFKIGSIEELRVGKGLLYGCFQFQFTFITEEEKQSNATLELPGLQKHLP
jgi:hypothetical protein